MPRGTNQGLFYAPSPKPVTKDPQEVMVWCEREFLRIASVLREGGSQGLRLDVLQVLPARPIDGMILFFAAGVAGVTEGSYEFSSGTWRKL